jgi:hypothetical protein
MVVIITPTNRLHVTGELMCFRSAEEGSVVAQRKVPVAKEVIDVADTPTYDTLEHLLDSVSKSYR